MKELSSIYQKSFEHLVESYSQDEYYEEVKGAKELYTKRWGAIVEKDPNYEARLQQFFDWYIFERNLDKEKKTPLDHFLLIKKVFNSETEEELFKSMKKNFRTIFRIKKVKKDLLVLQDLMDNKKYQLENFIYNYIFKPDMFLDGRLIFTSKGPLLSNGFCLHPKDASKYILKKMKAIRKGEEHPEEKRVLLHDFLKKLNDMYNLHLIYKHVEIQKVYSDNSPLKK